MGEHKQQRNPGLDIVRIFAFFCVVSVHFFQRSGYYSIIISGQRMYLATLVRTFFMICVPLFIVLSGYLMKTKRPTKQYYHKLGVLLTEYVLASICCLFYRAWTEGRLQDFPLYLLQKAYTILSFEAAPYGWYVEMYIGLFILIPYLNILYDVFPDAKDKRRLIFTLLFLTALPDAVNNLLLNKVAMNEGADSLTYLTLLPRWWNGFYPISYYYIGAYLKDYPLELRKSTFLFLNILAFFVFGTLDYFRGYGYEFSSTIMQSHESLFTVIQTILVFCAILQFSKDHIGARTAKCLSYVSGLCFSAYLVSYIFDDIFYRAFGWYEQADVYKIEGYLIIVPLVYFSALMLSAVVNAIHKPIARLLTKEKHSIQQS